MDILKEIFLIIFFILSSIIFFMLSFVFFIAGGFIFIHSLAIGGTILDGLGGVIFWIIAFCFMMIAAELADKTGY